MRSEFDKYADEYTQEIDKAASVSGEKFNYFVETRIKLVKNALKGSIPGKILDYGCGIGITEIFFKRYFPMAQIWGIDTSTDSINKAKSLKLQRVNFDKPKRFKDNTFDVIYSNGTFHHINHDKHLKILADFHRILKPGGKVFIFENNPYNPLMMKVMRECRLDKDAKVITSDRLENVMKKAGFKVKKGHYYLFFPKAL